MKPLDRVWLVLFAVWVWCALTLLAAQPASSWGYNTPPSPGCAGYVIATGPLTLDFENHVTSAAVGSVAMQAPAKSTAADILRQWRDQPVEIVIRRVVTRKAERLERGKELK